MTYTAKKTRRRNDGLSAAARKVAQEREVIQSDYKNHPNPQKLVSQPGQLERLVINLLDRIFQMHPQPNANEQNQRQQQNQNENQPQNKPQSPFWRVFRLIKDLVNRPSEFVAVSKKLLHELQQQGCEVSSVDNVNRALLGILYVGGIPMTTLSNLGNAIGIPDFDPRQEVDYAALGGPKSVLGDSIESKAAKQRDLGLEGSVESENYLEVNKLGDSRVNNPYKTKPTPLE